MGISRGIACRGALGPDYSLVATQQTAQTSRHAANGGEARDYATWRPNGRHRRTWRAVRGRVFIPTGSRWRAPPQ